MQIFLTTYKEELNQENHYFGVWFDPEKKIYFLDINIAIKSKDKAILKAKEIGEKYGRKIISIFNPQSEDTHYM